MMPRAVVLEAAQAAGVTISEAEADSIVWNETGFPAFWNIPQDGATPEECFRKQVAEAIRRRRRRESPLTKRRRIAARLAEVQRRTRMVVETGDQLRARLGWAPLSDEQKTRNLDWNLRSLGVIR